MIGLHTIKERVWHTSLYETRVSKTCFLGHLKTVLHHKYLVMKGCFCVGLYYQGITHDLSKFSPTEFLVGARFFQGTRSPNNAEREEIGYSASWLHHKGRNRHHYEYWIDYNANAGTFYAPVKMPERYVAEMVMDRIAASKVYCKQNYQDSSPLEYYMIGAEFCRKNGVKAMHEDTEKLLYKLLYMLSVKGEAFTFAYIQKRLLKGKSVCLFDEVVKIFLRVICKKR